MHWTPLILSRHLCLTRGAELPGPAGPEVPHQAGSPPLSRQQLGLGVVLAEALPVIQSVKCQYLGLISS